MTARPALLASCVATLALLALPAAAQDRPVVFVPGLASGPETWTGAAGRLGERLAIAPHLPPLRWTAAYENQAEELQARLSHLPSSTVAIGHSNGGVAVRQWSRHRPLGALVTLGTPNQGAPLSGNLLTMVGYQWGLGWLIGEVHAAFARCCDWQGAFSSLEWWMAVVYGIGEATNREVMATLGVSAGAPVLAQMPPGSAFFSGLNGAANLGREAAAVPARVSIVSVADNFYDIGPFGVFGGSTPEYLDALADGAAYTLDYYAFHILATSGVEDTGAWQKAHRMWNLAAWIWSWDDAWCRAVSSPGAAFCAPNDTIVPAWSQVLPGQGVTVLDWGWQGPRHTSQTSWSDDKLYQALTGTANVAVRGAPAPGGGSGGGGGGGGEGNQDSGVGALRPGGVLLPGQSLSSPGGGVQLTYQHDGNLVVYRSDGMPLWASHTAGTSAGDVVMQWDGNLVVYDASGRAVWASHTHGHDRAWLALQDDRAMVIYSQEGSPLWDVRW